MKSQRGSALLIVLGMLSFMVISGLAFSVYMRSTRMTSSFTRRTVSTRQLAKAALAEAIDQIDRAVANDPHPGVRNPFRTFYESTLEKAASLTDEDEDETDTTQFDPTKIDNFWCGRILIGQGQSSDPDDPNTGAAAAVGSTTYSPKLVNASETVPVLTVEALAYLPPPLVNEARYYGQRTPTASWQTFGFDAGRFAYFAVDVSDYFDVNRICAGEPRSSDPAHRVTLGHIFETTAHSAAGDSSGWSGFLSFRKVSDSGVFSFSDVPFVSLADFNLALGAAATGGLKSPFYEAFKSGGNGCNKMCGREGDDLFEKCRLETFVTDSLEAARPLDEEKVDNLQVWDLNNENYQPFKENFLDQRQENRTLSGVWKYSSDTFKRLNYVIPTVGMCALSDYLDSDRIPISLGIPTVERVPMICGIKPNLGTGSLKVTTVLDADQTVSGEGTAEKIVKRTVHWRFDVKSVQDLVTGGNGVDVMVVYPFRDLEKVSPPQFSVVGKVQLFLSTEEMSLRTGNRNDILQWGTSGAGDDPATSGTASFVQNAVFNLPLDKWELALSTVPLDASRDETEKKCVSKETMALDRTKCATLIASKLAEANGDLLRVTYQWTQHGTDDGNGGYVYDNQFQGEIPKIGTANANVEILSGGSDKPAASWLPVNAQGEVDSSFLNDIVSKPSDDIKFYLNAAVSLRVISSDPDVRGSSSGTKTVDMVPATIYDDEPVNEINNSIGRLAVAFCGNATPLMKFETGITPTVNPQRMDYTAQNLSLAPAAVMVDDPRFNHLPENWKRLDTFSEDGWLQAITAHARDGDIFMNTSDQNEMQSVYELAFLPRFSNLTVEGLEEDMRGNLSDYVNLEWKTLGQNTPVDADLMWKTYDFLGRYSDDGDDFEGLALENSGRGLRVNPYSDSASVILAAFANTPHDWRAASPNEQNAGADLSEAAFNGKYAWNQYSSGAKISWAKLTAIADEFSYCVQQGFEKTEEGGEDQDDDYSLSGISGSYRDVLDGAFRRFFGHATGTDAEWNLCNINLKSDSNCTPVYGVDKKFLFGYWKGCFAARQQLFLVFFRSEPMALGGGLSGVTPPQLGARGVALVWRDPNDPKARTKANVTRTYPTPTAQGNGTDVYYPHQTRILFYRQFE